MLLNNKRKFLEMYNSSIIRVKNIADFFSVNLCYKVQLKITTYPYEKGYFQLYPLKTLV